MPPRVIFRPSPALYQLLSLSQGTICVCKQRICIISNFQARFLHLFQQKPYTLGRIRTEEDSAHFLAHLSTHLLTHIFLVCFSNRLYRNIERRSCSFLHSLSCLYATVIAAFHLLDLRSGFTEILNCSSCSIPHSLSCL